MGSTDLLFTVSSASLSMLCLRAIPKTLWLLAALVVTANCGFAQDSDGRISDEKLNQVLLFATEMADKGLADLSFEAVTRALGAGPPFALRNERNEARDPVEIFQQNDNAVFLKLSSLVGKWKQKQFDPKGIYRALKVVVCTRVPGSGVHLYQFTEPVAKESMLERSVGSLLIDAAIVAGETQDLLSTLESIEQSAESPGPRLDVEVLRLGLAMKAASARTNSRPSSMSVESIIRRLLTLDDSTLAKCPAVVRDPLLLQLRSLQENSSHEDAATRLLRKVLFATSSRPGSSSGIQSGVSKLPFLLTVAEIHKAFLTGNNNEAIQLIELTDNQAIAIGNGMSQTTRNASLLEYDRLVARWLLQFGQTERALQRLRQCVDRDRQMTPLAIGTLSTAGAMWQEIQQLPANDRFEVLFEGAFLPGTSQIRIPTFVKLWEQLPPEQILSSLPEAAQTCLIRMSSSESHRTTGNSFSALLSAAIECDRLAEVEKRLSSDAASGDNRAATSPSTIMAKIAIRVRQHRDTEARQLLSSLPSLPVLCQSEQAGWMLVMMLQEMSQREEFIPDVQWWLSQQTGDADSRQQALLSEIRLRTLPEMKYGDHPAPSQALMIAGSNRVSSARNVVALPATWVRFEGITAHLSGTGNDQLYFPYPLAGDFTITGRALSLPGAESDVGFDGLCFESSANGILSVSSLRNYSRSLRSVSFHETGLWDRKAITVSNQSVELRDNGYLIWTGARQAQNSPWFFLSSSCGRRSYWQDFQISGQVSIPRQVSLVGGPDLRGWSCNAFDQDQTRSDAFITPAQAEKNELTKSYDWSCQNGLITGRRKERSEIIGTMTDITAQGLLQYDRPLVSGETLTWEFEYVPGQVLCHPCLGRVAIVLSEDSAALNWIPVSADDRSLFPVGHMVDVYQSHDKPLLTSGWNTGRVEMKDTQAEVFINEQKVAVLPTASSTVGALPGSLRGSRYGIQFGLFHYVHQTKAHVRNVVLSGPWPESLSSDEFAAIISGDRSTATRTEYSQWLQESFGEAPFELSVEHFTAGVASLSEAERLSVLKSWVMPDQNSPRWRLYAAPGVRANRIVPNEEAVDTFYGRRRNSSSLNAPVTLLLDLAEQTGQLSALRDEIRKWEQVTSTTDDVRSEPTADNGLGAMDQRSVIRANESLASKIVLTMIDLREKPEVAGSSLKEIAERVSRQPQVLNQSTILGLLMVADQASSRPEYAAEALNILQLLSSIPDRSAAYEGRRNALRNQIASLKSLLQTRKEIVSVGQSVQPLNPWTAFRSLRAKDKAAGQPESLWIQHPDSSIQHVMGSDVDVLTWPVPLKGNLEVSCRLHAVNGRFPAIGFGEWFFEPNAKDKRVDRYRMGRGKNDRTQPIEAAVNEVSCDVTLAVSDQSFSLSIDGATLLTEPINSERGNWLCFRASRHPGSRISNIEIKSATPSTLATLETNELLPGWSAPWFSEDDVFPKGNPGSMDWRSSEGQLVGVRRTTMASTGNRSVLKSFRPLLGNGMISWSFFHAAKDRNVFPVLGDTAFIVESSRQPSIHRLKGSHWETADASFDPQSRAPADVVLGEPELRENDWNDAELEIKGDRAILTVNNKPVMEQTISDDNDRTFGFLHWNGEFEAAVRHIDWAPAPQ